MQFVQLVQRAQKKLYLDQMVNGGQSANIDMEGLGAKELLGLIKVGYLNEF